MDYVAGGTRTPGNRRLELLEKLFDEMGESPKLEESHWQSLGAMVVDAAQTCDDESLEAAYTGLQWLFGERDVLDSPDEEQLTEKGRALGMLDLTRWHLRRGVSSALPAFPRDGQATQLLEAIAAHPGSRNKDLMGRLGVDETQLSRLGRQLRTMSMAWSQKTGRENSWLVTPRGLSCLRALGMEPSVDQQPQPLPEVEAERVLRDEEAQILTTALVEKPQHVRRALRESDLSGRAVERGVEFLVRQGYATQDEGGALRVNTERHRAVGVSVTPSEISASLTDLRAAELRSRARKIDRCAPEMVIAVIKDLCAELLEDPELAGDDVAGLGVSLPGHMDSRNGVVVNSALGDNWSGVPLARRLRQETGLPTAVENDVDAFTLQEQFFGHTRLPDDVAVVYVATNAEGVGGGLVVGGSLARGSHGAAGEIGHIPVAGNHDKCWCGNTGCLETVVSFTAMRNRIMRAGGSGPATLAEAAAMVEHGEAAAAAAFQASGTALGQGIATLLAVVDPAQLIIAAPVEMVDVNNRLRSARLFTKAARKSMSEHAYADLDRTVVKFRSLAGPSAACGAASALLLRRLYKSNNRWPEPASPRQHEEADPTGVL